MVHMLVPALVLMGSMPPPALCVGEEHDSHLVSGFDAGHSHDAEEHHEHSEASSVLCDHAMVPDGGCPDDNCIDVVLQFVGTTTDERHLLRGAAGQAGSPAPRLDLVRVSRSIPAGFAAAPEAAPPSQQLHQLCRLLI